MPAPYFDNFTPVNMADYQTYRTYGWAGVQFTTDSGMRCRIYDGPESFQYSAGVDCWGALPGVPPGINFAKVSLGPYDKDSLKPITNYHLLAPGQKIVVPGARDGRDFNNAVCAAGTDGSLTCEVQNMSIVGNPTHGFWLSPNGSYVFCGPPEIRHHRHDSEMRCAQQCLRR